MSIHINCNTNFMCKKCNQAFENEDKLKEHIVICMKEQIETDDQNMDVDEKQEIVEKGSLIGDEEEPEEPEVEYESEAGSGTADSTSDKSNDSDSDSSASSSDDDDDDDDASKSSDSKDSDDNSDEQEDSQDAKEKAIEGQSSITLGEEDSSDQKRGYEVCESEEENYMKKEHDIEEYGLDDKNSVLMTYSDDEGPPLLSPMMPSVIKSENEIHENQENLRHTIESMDNTENSILKETVEIDEKTEDSDSSSAEEEEEEEEEDGEEAEEEEEGDGQEEEEEQDEEEQEEELGQDAEEEEQVEGHDQEQDVEEENDEHEEEYNEEHEEEHDEEFGDERDEEHEEKHEEHDLGNDEIKDEEEEEDEEAEEHEISEDENQDQIVDNNSCYQEDNNQRFNEEFNDSQEEIHEQCLGENQNDENIISEHQILEMDENDLQNLNGKVLMLATNADGNQIYITRNMDDLGGDEQDITEYVFQDENNFNIEDYESIVHDQEQDYTGIKELSNHNEEMVQLHSVEGQEDIETQECSEEVIGDEELEPSDRS